MINFQGLLEKVGVEGIAIKSGKNKDIGSPFRKMTDEEKGLLQAVIDDVHAQFVDAVSKGRSLDLPTTQGLADGRIFTGRQAKKVGLVDELGSLQDTIKMTAEMVGIEGEPEVVETEEIPPFFEMMQERFRPFWGLQYLPTFRLSYLLAF
jgi:protease-4